MTTTEQRTVRPVGFRQLGGNDMNRQLCGPHDHDSAAAMYGAALNEGRELFRSNEQFRQWVRLCQLDTDDRHDRAAAMWAAGNLSEYRETRLANLRVRTVRGLHANRARGAQVQGNRVGPM